MAALSSAVVVSPHDGELRLLTGQVAPPSDRMAAARELARRTGATVLLKGSTTVVASPSVVTPSVLLIDAGTEALATAGTGDVLSGVIAAPSPAMPRSPLCPSATPMGSPVRSSKPVPRYSSAGSGTRWPAW